MNVLEQFHKDNAKEYNLILEDFNILFYGYGCKSRIIDKLFPRSIVLNCHNMNINDITTSLKNQIIKSIRPKNPAKYTLMEIMPFIKAINNLFTRENSFILVLINFRKEFTFLINSNIKVVCTVENVFLDLSQDDIHDYNFIMRDLTTFTPYSDEIVDINLDSEIKKLLVVENLLKSVSKKAGDLFIATIKTFEVNTRVTFSSLMTKVGKKFLITTLASMKDHLHEFFDHKIFKITNDGGFMIVLGKGDVEKILEMNKKE